jgi:hypothetical protein
MREGIGIELIFYFQPKKKSRGRLERIPEEVEAT